MIKHLTAMLAAATLIVVCMFYPFLPGAYDGLAVTLSAMSQVFGIAGLLLVPIGAIWLAWEWRGRIGVATPGKRFEFRFGLAALCAASVVVIAIALGSAIDAHLSFGVCLLLLWAYSVFRLVVWLRRRRRMKVGTFNPMPLYLVVLPIVAAVFMFTLVAPAAEFSRNRAIDNCAGLISDIERFRNTHGGYPHSLQSLNEDYKPRMIGIERYHYEPNGAGYNLYFKHFAVALDVKEIVMFNPRGEHEFTSHNADLLQYTPAQLSRSRGHFSVRDASRPKWKYFLFD
ncbi:MAG: hypothetical protein L0220_35650 [Acidobacteria bacterium]|nr:hypothetical protein [Acidobacteriota bacterium]